MWTNRRFIMRTCWLLFCTGTVALLSPNAAAHTLTLDFYGEGSVEYNGSDYTALSGQSATISGVSGQIELSATPAAFGNESDEFGWYYFGAWRLHPDGDVTLTATLTTINIDRDTTYEVYFIRPRDYITAYSLPASFEIASNGPTMPTVSITMTADPADDLPSHAEMYYRIQIGEQKGTSPDFYYEILHYPDYPGASLNHAQRIDSGLSPSDTLVIYPDSQTPNNTGGTTLGWDQDNVGVGGGFPRHITLSCYLHLNPDEPTCVGNTVERTVIIANENLTGLHPDQKDATGLFHIVGEQPSASTVDAYIDTLDLRCISSTYDLYEGTGPAELGGEALEFQPIVLCEGGGPVPLPWDYEEAQLLLMLHKVHRQESSTRMFYGTAQGENYASRQGYPLWEDARWRCTTPGCDQYIDALRDGNGVVKTCPSCGQSNWVGEVNTNSGVGLYQLTSPDYKTRESIWNWKKNTLMATKILMKALNESCSQLDGHHPEFSGAGANVFEPGLDEDGGSFFSFTFDLDVMRRMNSLNRYNGGLQDRYYWWNDSGPTPSFINANGITGGTITASYDIDQTLTCSITFSLDDIAHNFSGASSATLHGYDQSSRLSAVEATTTAQSGFDWDLSPHSAASFLRNDRELWFKLGIWEQDSLRASAQIRDSGVQGSEGGLRPPSDHWVKFGYKAVGDANLGWRDYNTDRVADIDTDPFGLGLSTVNSITGRSTRYADNCEKQTTQHSLW